MEMWRKKKKSQNEQSACEAFVAILNSITGTQYEKSGSPDELNRQTPDVDFLLVSIGDPNDIIAVEHTTVESFEGQIGYVSRSYDIVGSINACCRNRIPADRYYFLAIPPALVDSLVGKNRMRFVSDLSSWVAETAQKMGIDSYSQTDHEGHVITLTCGGSNAQLNGNVWRMPQQPQNEEILQTQRFNRAIRDKLPKLSKYKAQGFKTALLLEDIAGIPLGSTHKGHGITLKERRTVRATIDYIVVFTSNKGRMIVGNVLKEKAVWHSSIPYDRRFSFR